MSVRLSESPKRDDVQLVKEQQMAHEAEILEHKAKNMIVASDEDMKAATDLMAVIKISEKNLEEQRKFLVKPLNDHVKNINDRFKLYSVPLQRATTILKNKVLAYRQELERKRREEEARLQAEARAEQERLAALAEANELPPPPPIIMRAPATEVPKAARSIIGSAAFSKEWKFEIVNESLIPREYMSPDEKKIRAVIKAGIREIPGIRIYQEDSMSVRVR